MTVAVQDFPLFALERSRSPTCIVGWPVTVIDTVAAGLASEPSLTAYVNESLPEKFAFGVYVTVAVSLFGEPEVHAAAAIGPSDPFVGWPTIEKASSQVSASEPPSVIVTGVFAAVVALVRLAVGAVLGGGGGGGGPGWTTPNRATHGTPAESKVNNK